MTPRENLTGRLGEKVASAFRGKEGRGRVGRVVEGYTRGTDGECADTGYVPRNVVASARQTELVHVGEGDRGAKRIAVGRGWGGEPSKAELGGARRSRLFAASRPVCRSPLASLTSPMCAVPGRLRCCRPRHAPLRPPRPMLCRAPQRACRSPAGSRACNSGLPCDGAHRALLHRGAPLRLRAGPHFR